MRAEHFLHAENKFEAKRTAMEVEILADIGQALSLPVRLHAEGMELLLDERISFSQELDDRRKTVYRGNAAVPGGRNAVAMLHR